MAAGLSTHRRKRSVASRAFASARTVACSRAPICTAASRWRRTSSPTGGASSRTATSQLEVSYGFAGFLRGRLCNVVTIAFDGTLFHETATSTRNRRCATWYLDVQITKHATAWVGSRMYRGDDIYLFDYWPLDDLNTIFGGGLYVRKTESDSGKGDALELATHAGVNRLANDFQFQEVERSGSAARRDDRGAAQPPAHGVVGNRGVHAVGRRRRSVDQGEGARRIYVLTSGRVQRTDGSLEALPSDRGDPLGAWSHLFNLSRVPQFRRHLNVYARYAKGLAAFDELAPPTSFGPDLKTDRANELTFGVAGTCIYRRERDARRAVAPLRRLAGTPRRRIPTTVGSTRSIFALSRGRSPTCSRASIAPRVCFPWGSIRTRRPRAIPAVFQIRAA